MNEIILALTIKIVGEECNDIICPACNDFSKPHGLGKQSGNKIQLVRKCRFCNKLFWYWIDYKHALIPFGE